MKKRQYQEVYIWQTQTFGKATPFSKIAHLREELDELEVALANMKMAKEFKNEKYPYLEEQIQNEFADCIMLIFGAAASHGLSFDQLCEAHDRKMKINRSREWGEPDENGVVHHIKTNPDRD